MKKIKGNQTAVIQKRTVTSNDIGEQVEAWTDEGVSGLYRWSGEHKGI